MKPVNKTPPNQPGDVIFTKSASGYIRVKVLLAFEGCPIMNKLPQAINNNCSVSIAQQIYGDNIL
jgi:hypothetical protein